MYSPEHKEHNDLISSPIVNLKITQGLGLFNFFPTQMMTAMQYPEYASFGKIIRGSSNKTTRFSNEVNELPDF